MKILLVTVVALLVYGAAATIMFERQRQRADEAQRVCAHIVAAFTKCDRELARLDGAPCVAR